MLFHTTEHISPNMRLSLCIYSQKLSPLGELMCDTESIVHANRKTARELLRSLSVLMIMSLLC